LDQKNQKLQNRLIFKIFILKIKNDEWRIYYFGFLSFFDPIGRIDPKRKNFKGECKIKKENPDKSLTIYSYYLNNKLLGNDENFNHKLLIDNPKI
jgi:hypothetical protein